MEVKESEKLQYQEFKNSVDNVPLQTLYITQQSDSYTSSGYSFYIKSPSQDALLDPDIWIKYRLKITETVANAIRYACFESAVANRVQFPANPVVAAGAGYSVNRRLALRQAFPIQRCTQNFIAVINGHSITSDPFRYIDILNRLFVSRNQSKHIFSSSGGEYDSGNHGVRTMNDATFQTLTGDNDVDALAAGDRTIVKSMPGFSYPQVEDRDVEDANATANRNAINAQAGFPWHQDFFNEGFSNRCMNFARICRNKVLSTAALGAHFVQDAAGGGLNAGYWIEIFERLPMPPFKMYPNDGCYGIIPNIKDLTIRGQFVSNMRDNLLQSNYNYNATTAAGEINIGFSGSTSDCQLYLRWYTPPPNVSIPKEISIPLRKINTWAKTYTLTVSADAAAEQGGNYGDTSISEYNISLDAVPDLLLIYVKYASTGYTMPHDSDGLMELVNLQLNLEGASGKVNQIQTIELYQYWLNNVKHGDHEDVEYEEWRKYCCVAALRPEDYGIIKGPGYENQITLGITCIARNWHRTPSIFNSPAEANLSTSGELIVTSIYDKYSLNINSSGSASSTLTRVRPTQLPLMSSQQVPQPYMNMALSDLMK